MNKFLYILSHDRFIEKLKLQKPYKYIPHIILNRFNMLKEPKILSEFKYENKIIGYSIGLSTLKNIEEDKKIEEIEKLINKNSEDEFISSVIFEDGYNFYIENKLLEKSILKPNDYSKEIKLKIIPFIIGDIARNFHEKQESLEVLIIYDIKEDCKKIIKKIPFKIKKIYIYNEKKSNSLEIAEEILADIGLSIGIINNIEKINRFDIVINFKSDISFINRVQEKSVVFNIYNNIFYNLKRPLILDDFIFKNKNLNIDLNFNLPSDIYKYNDKFKINDLIQIKANGKINNLKEITKASNYNIS